MTEAKFKNEKLDQNLVFGLLLSGIDLQTIAAVRIGALPNQTPGSDSDTSAQISLGEKIFKDKSLSLNGVQSCSTCHLLTGRNAGTDAQSTSRGTLGQVGRRNALSIFNVGFQETLFWDGRINTLEDQALMPFVDQNEMSLPSISELINRLNTNSDYVQLFAQAFPDSPNISTSHIKKSISAFERSLITPSRFDEFIKGDNLALNIAEKQGLRLFLDLNCIKCHQGHMLGGGKFVKLDSVFSYNNQDLGRYEFTLNESDKYFFRTPSLRNVALTAPYFHDGSVSTLTEAVRRMNHYESPRTISESEILILVNFLKTLSDKPRSLL
ncbi:MAG: cytochrome c peroxidase [Leptospira sp.]|nr:cytochrome c peroxidase [Leptospira sp.]